MRDRETIDSELRRVAAELRSIRQRGGQPSSQQVDALLDERLGHPVEVLCDTAVLDEILAPFEGTVERRRSRRRGRLLRLAMRAAVPVSAFTIAAALVALLVLHRHHRSPQPSPEPMAESVAASQTSTVASPPLVPPAKATSPAEVAEKAMIDALQHEGVPVPSRDYVTTHGHAVCDFLGRQPNITDATQFVQRSTVWDAHESADFTAAAIVTYCPQFESTGTEQAQQTFQKSVTTLQTIEDNLRGINNDLQDISDGLHGGG